MIFISTFSKKVRDIWIERTKERLKYFAVWAPWTRSKFAEYQQMAPLVQGVGVEPFNFQILKAKCFEISDDLLIVPINDDSLGIQADHINLAASDILWECNSLY